MLLCFFEALQANADHQGLTRFNSHTPGSAAPPAFVAGAADNTIYEEIHEH